MSRARSVEAKLARREQILSAAVELLAHERYEQLTMASVARAAGLAKGTPYLYWRTKEELFLAALQEEYGAYLIGLARAIRAADGSDDLPFSVEPLPPIQVVTDPAEARP